jgi:prepilin-type N-terminal cleavage/methylation domain-containing protein
MSRRSISQSPAAGFSFIEVLIALSILLVGSLSILSLFAVGVDHMVQRRIEQRTLEAIPQVGRIVQDLVNEGPPRGGPPKDVKDYPLSLPGYTVDIRFSTKTIGDEADGNQVSLPGINAIATLKNQGRALRVLTPFSVVRSTLEPKAEGEGGQ